MENNKKRWKKIVTAFFISTVIFGGFFVFGSGNASATTNQSASWTIIAYLDADNNLEGYEIQDFLQMAKVGSTSEVNIVVGMDRA